MTSASGDKWMTGAAYEAYMGRWSRRSPSAPAAYRRAVSGTLIGRNIQAGAAEITEKKLSRKIESIETRHGVTLPYSGPCKALSPHGFYGVEEKVVEAIALWLSGKPVPEKVE